MRTVMDYVYSVRTEYNEIIRMRSDDLLRHILYKYNENGRVNVVLTGCAGSGKTTLCNKLKEHIPNLMILDEYNGTITQKIATSMINTDSSINTIITGQLMSPISEKRIIVVDIIGP